MPVKRILFFGILVLVGVVAFLLYRHLEKKALNGRLILDDAKLYYVRTLRDALKDHPNPEIQSSASLFISASTVNTLLAAATNSRFEVPNAGHISILIQNLQAHFSDGFPEVDATVHIDRPNPSISLDASLSAVLEPRLDNTAPNVLQFYLHPLSLKIGLTNQAVPSQGNEIAGDILSKLAVAYGDLLPHFTFPLSRDFSVAFPATNVPLPVPTQAGKLNGELDVPGLSFRTDLSLSGLVFLSDGIHIFTTAALNNPGKVANAVLLPFSTGTRPVAHGTADIDSAITSEESQIASIQDELKNLGSALRVSDADLRIWASSNLLTQVVTVFNSLTPDQRRVHFHTISEDGQLYRAGGGGLGCGGYAELVGGNSASGNLQVGNLASTWKPGQGVVASADFQFAFDAQVTGHVNGPAGPHPTWVLNCVHLPWPINKDVCTNLPSVTVSCETPVGGGVGLGSYGISGNRTEKLTAAVTLHSDASSWLVYDLSVVAPDQVPITISVGLGQLGTLGLPFNFSVPHQTLLSGKAPPIFEQAGMVDIPGTHTSKKYSLSVVPTAATVKTEGYEVKATVKVQLQ